MPPKARRGEFRSWRAAEAAAVFAAVVSTVSVIGPSLGLSRSTVFALTIPILSATVFIVVAGRRALATRTIPAQIAIGGSHGVGKTVYTNVVASRLSESESSELRFTPEARTAQQVYRVISDLRRERWPGRTGRDAVDRYRGKVELLDQSLWSSLIRGRIEFDLELLDSAGELWDEVAEAAPRERQRLVDTTFFEQVGEASALLYFIGADTLQTDPERVADHVDDLLSTLQVLRSIEPRGTPLLSKPIALVISKADLLHPVHLQVLSDLFAHEPASFRGLPSDSDFRVLDERFLASLERLEHLTIVMHRQVQAFGGFVISALAAAKAGPSSGASDPLIRVELPIEWGLRQVLRS
jgi:hypothetical protein